MPVNDFLRQYPVFKVQGGIFKMRCLVLIICSKSSCRSVTVLYMGLVNSSIKIMNVCWL